MPRALVMRSRCAVAALAAALVACTAPNQAPLRSDAPPRAVAGRPASPVALAAGYPELRVRFDADASRARLLVLASPS